MKLLQIVLLLVCINFAIGIMQVAGMDTFVAVDTGITGNAELIQLEGEDYYYTPDGQESLTEESYWGSSSAKTGGILEKMQILFLGLPSLLNGILVQIDPNVARWFYNGLTALLGFSFAYLVIKLLLRSDPNEL
jgi:hypothetical protein